MYREILFLYLKANQNAFGTRPDPGREVKVCYHPFRRCEIMRNVSHCLYAGLRVQKRPHFSVTKATVSRSHHWSNRVATNMENLEYSGISMNM